MRCRHLARTVLIGIGCSLLAALAAAQKISVESHRDERADFSAIRTYVWLPTPPGKTNIAPDAVTNPNMSQKVLGPHVIAAVDRQLTLRGLKRVEEGQADVKVVYYASLNVNVSAAELGSYYQYTTGWATLPLGAAPTSSFEILERGTIVVDVIAPGSNTAIWRGTVATNVDHENTHEKRVERINEAMTRVFERFPIRPTRQR
jgi:uncharacterized protein DUF4136